ncbi:MAG: ankyrin repeat domain-containing protein [Vulcanimicrobiota bacterium]
MAERTKELFDALGRGEENMVRAILDSDPSLLKIRDSNGLEPVHYAAVLQSSEILKYLISLGAEVNARNFFGLMPLHYAGSKDIQDFLIANGALINADNNLYGKTPLHSAAMNGGQRGEKGDGGRASLQRRGYRGRG